MHPRALSSTLTATLLPYPTLVRSPDISIDAAAALRASAANDVAGEPFGCRLQLPLSGDLPFESRGLAELGLEVLAGDQVRARLQLEEFFFGRSEEHTSELSH